ncbi:DUF3889 domain-containing protein [Peribacillus asahii]|uniref:DUF3889 domain-containing protein n=1 Tax=Peribacillus asahii TaxID=228899 RepID=UPI00207AC00C|nr:DUF3889 domain-containing protein [Peribacillus asahii]USK70945.1 YqzG/YhdC family protein [Peribacillus asahii]
MLKKWSFIVLMFMMLTQAGFISVQQGNNYEKYGRISIAVVQADYPGDEVTDYQYEGRKVLEKGTVEDRFLFLVKEQGKEFNVRVKIKHSLSNNKLLNLSVEEVR